MKLSMLIGSALAGLAAALPATTSVPDNLSKRTFDCTTPVTGLLPADCQYLSQIGLFSQGSNQAASPGYNGVWIGSDGPNTMTITNSAPLNSTGLTGSAILVFWVQIPNNFQSSFMNAVQAAVTYSLPNPGDKVTISVADGVSGGLSYVRNGVTALSQYGQIGNSWVEFTTGTYATLDVSLEVNMAGLPISAQVTNNGCVSDMNTCVFKCTDGTNSCLDNFDLFNCNPGSQPGATYGHDPITGKPSGGCQGWSANGVINIGLGEGFLTPGGVEPVISTTPAA